MGFGILFFGYFMMFAFSLSSYYFFADIIGTLLVIYSFSKLSEYNRYFAKGMIPTLLFLVFCALTASSMMFGLYEPDSTAAFAVSILKLLSAAAVHVFMFLGIRGISLGAQSSKLVKAAERDFAMTSVYYLFAVLTLVFSSFIEDAVPYVSAVVYLYQVVCIFLNLVLIYKCFGILLPADEDPDAKKRSRFKLVNMLSDKFDELDDKKNEYKKESIDMALKEAERRAEEKKNKSKHNHNHKKKK